MKKVNVNRLKVNVLHLFHLLPLVNLGQQRGNWHITCLLISSMEEIMRGAQELFIKMSGSNLVKSLHHLLSGNYCKISLLFPLYIACYMPRNTPTHDFYLQFKAYLGRWGRQFQEWASDAQLFEDEAEGHPDCMGSLLRVRGSYRIAGDFWSFH